MQFSDLWYRHPANLSTQYPCIAPTELTNLAGEKIRQGFPVFSNQCAIRMGVALKHAGLPPSALRGVTTCGVHDPDEMHYIRAQELASAIERANLTGVGKIERIVGADVQAFYPKLIGRTGMLYIKDYWRRSGETNPTGDHIDVWNGYRSSTKWLMEWFSWAGYYSNYADARELWFWEVK